MNKRMLLTVVGLLFLVLFTSCQGVEIVVPGDDNGGYQPVSETDSPQNALTALAEGTSLPDIITMTAEARSREPLPIVTVTVTPPGGTPAPFATNTSQVPLPLPVNTQVGGVSYLTGCNPDAYFCYGGFAAEGGVLGEDNLWAWLKAELERYYGVTMTKEQMDSWWQVCMNSTQQYANYKASQNIVLDMQLVATAPNCVVNK